MPIERRYPESIIFLIICFGYSIMAVGLFCYWEYNFYPHPFIWLPLGFFGISFYLASHVIRIREEGLEIPHWIFRQQLIPWEQIKEIFYQPYSQTKSIYIHYQKNQKDIHFRIPRQLIKDQSFITRISHQANLPLPEKYLQFIERWDKKGQTPWRIGWTVIILGILPFLAANYYFNLPYGMGLTDPFSCLLLVLVMMGWSIERKPRIDWIMVFALCSLMIEIFILIMISIGHSNLPVSLIPISINITVLVLLLYALWGMNNRHPYILAACLSIILMASLIVIPIAIIPQAKSQLQLSFKAQYWGRVAISPADDVILDDLSLGHYSMVIYNASQKKWTTYPNQYSHDPSFRWYHIISWNKQGNKALIISATYCNESTHTSRKELGIYDKKTNQITPLYQIDIPNELGRRNENIELKGEWNAQGNQLIYWEPVIFYPELRVEYRLVLYNPDNNSRQGILQSPLNPYKTIWKDNRTLLIITGEPEKPRRTYGGNYYKLWKLVLPPSGAINSKTIKTQLLYSIDTPDYHLIISPANNLIMIQSINSKNMEASPFNKLWDLDTNQMKDIPQPWQISAKGLWESCKYEEIVFHPHDKKYLIIKNDNELWEVSCKDFTARKIFKERFKIYHPIYSPDGLKICYSVSKDAIAIINTDGTGWKLIRICAPLDDIDLCFSADSKYLFLFSKPWYERLGNRLYIYQLDPNTPLPKTSPAPDSMR